MGFVSTPKLAPRIASKWRSVRKCACGVHHGVSQSVSQLRRRCRRRRVSGLTSNKCAMGGRNNPYIHNYCMHIGRTRSFTSVAYVYTPCDLKICSSHARVYFFHPTKLATICACQASADNTPLLSGVFVSCVRLKNDPLSSTTLSSTSSTIDEWSYRT